MPNALDQLDLASTYTGIENRLVKLDLKTPDMMPLSIEGHFFYMKFKNKMPSSKELAEYVYYKIIDFCIPRSVKLEYRKKIEETGDNRYILELSDIARESFISAIESIKTSGESGEVLLFILLESFLNAPQIACKMYLKTNSDMPVHGTDGIHILYNANDDSLILIWGESKIYEVLSDAMDSICSSINDFTKCKKGKKPQRNEDIKIIKAHADLGNKNIKEHLLKYFDPYCGQSNRIKEKYCCFIGFDYSFYKKLLRLEESEVENVFVEKYKEKIVKSCSLFRDKIINSNLEKLNFIFMLLPFDSVHEFRKKFYEYLGV